MPHFLSKVRAGLEGSVFPWPFLTSRGCLQGDPHALAEERRLLYVAMTRAKYYLHLLRAKMRLTPYGKVVINGACPFLGSALTTQRAVSVAPPDAVFTDSLDLLISMTKNRTPPVEPSAAPAGSGPKPKRKRAGPGKKIAAIKFEP
jgi:hypothetical protein